MCVCFIYVIPNLTGVSSCSRIPISQAYVDMVIGRLRSDDIYNQVNECVEVHMHL